MIVELDNVYSNEMTGSVFLNEKVFFWKIDKIQQCWGIISQTLRPANDPNASVRMKISILFGKYCQTITPVAGACTIKVLWS